MVTAASRRRASAAVSRGGWARRWAPAQALWEGPGPLAPTRGSCESWVSLLALPLPLSRPPVPSASRARPQKAGGVIPASGESLPSLESRGGSGSH